MQLKNGLAGGGGGACAPSSTGHSMPLKATSSRPARKARTFVCRLTPASRLGGLRQHRVTAKTRNQGNRRKALGGEYRTATGRNGASQLRAARGAASQTRKLFRRLHRALGALAETGTGQGATGEDEARDLRHLAGCQPRDDEQSGMNSASVMNMWPTSPRTSTRCSKSDSEDAPGR